MTIMNNTINPVEAPDCQTGRSMLLGWITYIAVHGFNREIKEKYVRIRKYYIHELKSAPTGPKNNFGCLVIHLNLQIMVNDISQLFEIRFRI